MSNFKTGRWSKDEEAMLQRLKDEGLTAERILPFLLRSESAIKEKWHYMNLSEFGREERRQALRRRRMTANPPTGEQHFEIEHVASRPDAALLAERDRRLALPSRDLTAALLGDPPIGYSALDRKREVAA